MNYLNLHTDLLRCESYLDSEPVERATWLNLLAWCATQENGGVIPGAEEWKDRKWQQICGVTLAEVSLISSLYHFTEAGDLVVNLYPVEKEEEVKNKRLNAQTNGKKGGRPPKPKTQTKPTLETQTKPTLVPDSAQTETNVAKRKEKGRERERKEKGKEGNAPEVSDSPPGSSPLVLESEKRRTREAINSLKPAFSRVPEFSPVENLTFEANSSRFSAFTPEDWDLLRRFIASPEAQSSQFIFASREMFMTHHAEALQKAADWDARNDPSKWGNRSGGSVIEFDKKTLFSK